MYATFNEADNGNSFGDQEVPTIGEILLNPLNEFKLFRCIENHRYACGVCGEMELGQHLRKHHSKMHFEIPFTKDSYQLCTIDKQIQCLICYDEHFAENFEEHVSQCHPEILNQLVGIKEHTTVTSLACDDEDVEENFQENTNEYYPEFHREFDYEESFADQNDAIQYWTMDQQPQHNQITNDVFEIIEQFQSMCDVNGDQQDKLSNGISFYEFCLRASRNRICINNGQLQIKDSVCGQKK